MNTLYAIPGERIYARGQFDLRRVGPDFYVLFRGVQNTDEEGDKVWRFQVDQIFNIREDAIDYAVQSVREQGEWPAQTPATTPLELAP